MNDSAHGIPDTNMKLDEEGGPHKHPDQVLDQPDYVNKGEWYHIGFHMTAAVASVPTLGLPYAVALLGWPGGMIALVAGGLVTMFTCILIAGLLEFGGRRHLRYRNLAQAVIGPRLGWWAVAPFQFAVCIGCVIANHVVAGQAMKAVDVAIRGTTDVTLTEYIIVFGCANLLLSQCPHFHAIRYINAVATVCTISFSIIAVCMSIYNGTTADAPRDYTPEGDPVSKMFNAFNGLGIMAFAYGISVLPEIGATAKAPAERTLKRGIAMGYVIILTAYLFVSVTGFWAFGTDVSSIVLGSLQGPNWVIILAWMFAAVQLFGTTMVYCQPLFESYDCQFGNILAPVWCFRNTMVRLVCRTLFIVVACFIACLLPFFGDIMGFIGAVGFTPLDFILPQFLWIAAYNPKGPKKWFALIVAFAYTIVGIMAAIGAIRSIINNAVTYHIFANL
ncbi:hypothetical protein CVIRNUC_009224 [Coccomyxa viridis]|uniref:Amino acid transporter transmembrane domain-containing protein n=1 Tax=Coccomyxa viridis TaxID=1274662 RepID=A0AAV1IGS2_9CHLO|nr:hypothetical protein CVIRNUC_009224 [Coccomyxa viridis]